MARARGWWPIAATVLVLVAVNVASNRLVPKDAYVPFSLAATLVLLAIARRLDGRSWGEIGLARADMGRGLRWGAVLAGAVFTVYLVAYLVPATHDLYLDGRVEDASLAWVLFAALVRVPFGTVVLEEVAFRGVLPAELMARTSRRAAVAVSSLLFGLWHVLPALGLQSVNPVAQDTVGQLPGAFTVVLSVLATAAVGVVFWWLRDRSGSLLAPMALHWSTNALGYLFAWWAWNH